MQWGYIRQTKAPQGSSNTSKIHDVEMEIMTVLIEEEQSEDIFGLIYERGGLFQLCMANISNTVSIYGRYFLQINNFSQSPIAAIGRRGKQAVDD